MKKVSILLPIYNNYFQYKLSVEDAINKAGIHDFELIFFNNCSSDTKIKEWILELSNRKDMPEVIYLESEVVLRNSDVLNRMLAAANNEFICIIPCPTFLPENWLFELVSKNLSIVDSGISAIIDNINSKGNLSPKLTNSDDFIYVFHPENNMVLGVWLFHKSVMEKIGGFDTTMNSGYEYYQYSYRASAVGFTNYYLSDINSIIPYKSIENNCFFITDSNEFMNNVKQMIKSKNFTFKISRITSNEETARVHLPSLIKKFKCETAKEFYLNFSESWGFDIVGFSSDEVVHLDEYCKKYSLFWLVMPPKILKNAVSINFFEKDR